MRQTIEVICLLALLTAGCSLNVQQTQKPATDATAKTVAAAKAFLATLDNTAKSKVSFPFNSDQKHRWSNFPIGIYPRNGVRLGDLNPTQRDAVFNLLATALSARGLQKVKEIMEGDEVLKQSEAQLPTGPTGPPPEGPPPAAPADCSAAGINFQRSEHQPPRYRTSVGSVTIP